MEQSPHQVTLGTIRGALKGVLGGFMTIFETLVF